MLRAIRARLRRDDGAAAVETALVMPLLILVVFGVIEFSMLIKDHMAMNSAVRAASRVASAEPKTSSFADDAIAAIQTQGSALPMGNVNEVWVYEAGTNGMPTGQTEFSNCTTRCLRYTPVGDTYVLAGGSWDESEINACAGDPNITAVGIYMNGTHPFLTTLFQGSMDLEQHSVMRFEPIPSDLSWGTGSCESVV
jgi:Flp pilus assembly protein TadG